MKILILGGGPAGLYCGLLIKKAYPHYEITIIERNPADVTYGWGVVFSDRTLASFQRADYKTYEQITDRFVIWDAIDILYRGETIRCGGHIIASIARKTLLNILQRRCAELGITLHFGQEIHTLSELPEHDLLIGADGINSLVRRSYAEALKPAIKSGRARYIWLGAHKVLDAFTFIFRENEHGLFQVHAYPSSGSTSTFIVECDESSWLRAGLDKASEEESLRYCEQLFANELSGAPLLSNNSRWINFPTLTTQHWHHQRTVLLGDAVHTAHFSIGSGTKLAMEDAIALARALEQHTDLEMALNEYELERKPVVETFQQAARESQAYFETIKRYLGLEPMQFAFQLLTRSGRISYNDLRLRDVHFGDTVDRWYAQHAAAANGTDSMSIYSLSRAEPLVAPPPIFAPLRLRTLTLPNRAVIMPRPTYRAHEGLPDDGTRESICRIAQGGVGLVMAGMVAPSPEGRITVGSNGLYTVEQQAAWSHVASSVHTHTGACIGLELCHAGRRGSTRPRSEGLDRPLRSGNWPLLAASPIPYTAYSQVPKEMDHADMERVRDEFVNAAQMALAAGFDMLQLHYGHGYLLASFLSPLTNYRMDEYGGNLERRMRYPLEVFDAVRAAWPEDKPLSVALSVTDHVKNGLTIEDALKVICTLKKHGCDMITILAGQTVSDGDLPYGRGFLTQLSDCVRNETGIATMVGGYLTNSNEINTILAAGRADLCILEEP
jgi:anthraniloyl-CoA monooxygenase